MNFDPTLFDIKTAVIIAKEDWEECLEQVGLNTVLYDIADGELTTVATVYRRFLANEMDDFMGDDAEFLDNLGATLMEIDDDDLDGFWELLEGAGMGSDYNDIDDYTPSASFILDGVEYVALEVLESMF